MFSMQFIQLFDEIYVPLKINVVNTRLSYEKLKAPHQKANF